MQLGPELFRFESMQEWVNKGRSWYATCGYHINDLITLDAVGRVVRRGAHFSRAEEEGAYPVSVYAIDPSSGPSEALVADGISRELKVRHGEPVAKHEPQRCPSCLDSVILTQLHGETPPLCRECGLEDLGDYMRDAEEDYAARQVERLGCGPVWCVKHRDGWCATKFGRRPSGDALHDDTRCGHVVTLRVGSERRMPTCLECVEAVQKAARRNHG